MLRFSAQYGTVYFIFSFNEPAKNKNINGKPSGVHSAADNKMNNSHPSITDKIESNGAELKSMSS